MMGDHGDRGRVATELVGVTPGRYDTAAGAGRSGDASQERHAHVLGRRFAAALPEDIALVVAARTHEVTHVFDNPERWHVQLSIHPHGTA